MVNQIIRPTTLPPRASPVATEVTVSDNGAEVAGVTWAAGVNAALPAATKAEAEAGVVTNKRMEPLTTKQAIDFQVPVIVNAAIGDLNLGSAAQAQASDFATAAQGSTADSAVQPGDLAEVATSGDYDDLTNKPTARLMPAGGTTSQALLKSSNADYDVEWVTSAAATAVSYAPQVLTPEQKNQAVENIGAMSPAVVNNAASKTTPVDADELPLIDSAASWGLKKLTWANLEATLKAYFDTLYPTVEEGTFTPTVFGTTSAGDTIYTNQAGVYEKIGNVVFIKLDVRWSSSTGTGNMRIGGLPFFSSSGSTPLSFNINGIAYTGQAVCSVVGGANTIQIQSISNTGVASNLAMQASGILLVAGTYHVD